MLNAQVNLEKSRKTCIQLLDEVKASKCVENCEGHWLQCAKEVFAANGIGVMKFANSIFLLLQDGQGKYQNIMLVGPADCRGFITPSKHTFAWVSVNEAQGIFLNDFCWNKKLFHGMTCSCYSKGSLYTFLHPKHTTLKTFYWSQAD